MDETVNMPPSWSRAVIRFTDGYGSAPDFADATDVHGFLQLLEVELHSSWSHGAAEYWQEKTREKDEELLALFRRRIAEEPE